MGKPFFTYKYKGFGGCESVCNLEVYGNLVIATERGDNTGTAITNVAGQLATEICERFDIAPSKLIWVERYTANSYEDGDEGDERVSLVFFNLTGGTHFQKDFRFSTPRWVPVEKVVVDALIETHQK